jgi:threonine synthase
MNVGHPSNLARFFDLYGGTVDRGGTVHRYPDLEAIKKNIFSTSVGDGETRQTIKQVYDRYGVVLEPHGAVGWKGLEDYLNARGDFPLCVSLETAHPAKFPDDIIELLGVTPEVPVSLKDIDQRTGEPLELSADYGEFKQYLMDALKAKD